MACEVSPVVPPPRRILLIKPSSLGDIVHALPVLVALREAYPRAHIAWLVSAGFAALLEGHPLLDEIIPFDRQHYGHMWRQPAALADFIRFLTWLRRQRFELVVDLQGLFRSGFLAAVTGAPRRVGFADARELAPLFYTQRIRARTRRSEDIHAVELNLELARRMGLPVTGRPQFPMGLRPREIAAARAQLDAAASAQLGAAGGAQLDAAAARPAESAQGAPLAAFTAVLPGARWESKLWPVEHFAELVRALHAEGFPPSVLLGSGGDRARALDIARLAGVPVVNCVGQTSLRELAAVLSLASLVICQDSGPMHISAALGRSTVALFGSTNPVRTGPYSAAAHVLRQHLPCQPCYARHCPLDHQDCLRKLGVDEVLAKVRELYAGMSANSGASAGASVAPGAVAAPTRTPLR